MKKHIGFILTFCCFVILYFGSFFTLKSSFLGGDYLSQFYPWLMTYAQSIKTLTFPFWTQYFQSGFPLMAEGQIGGFYPLNIILFFLLPFKAAYNYAILINFFIAGISTYLFSRKIGCSQWGATIAVSIFCFASAYAGCFYNIGFLRTLCWFPFTLLLFEYFFTTHKKRFLVFAGICIGMQFLGGFLQMAVYAVGFYFFYFFYSAALHSFPLLKRIKAFFLLGIIALIIALPQLILSVQLALLTGRASADLGFALWNSFPPPLLMSAIFPYWLNILGNEMYIGIISIMFVIFSFYLIKTHSHIRPILLICILSFLFALGKYNPLYSWIIDITKLYSLRNPSKFTFFTMFSLSILAGYGFTYFFDEIMLPLKKKALNLYLWIISSFIVLFMIIKLSLPFFKQHLLWALNMYIEKNVAGKAYHRHDLETYAKKAQYLIQSLITRSDFNNIYIIASFIFIILSIILCIYIKKNLLNIRAQKLLITTILFIDIFVYSFYGTGFRGNIKTFASIEPTHKKILSILQNDEERFRILPFDVHNKSLPKWAQPNINILVNIESIGAYTPLVIDSYRAQLLNLEVVDNALGLLHPKEYRIGEYYSTLQLLNTKYILSPKRLSLPFLSLITKEQSTYLYKIHDYFPRIFFCTDIENIEPSKTTPIAIKHYTNGSLQVTVTTQEKGFIVFSETYTPKWEAKLNEKKVPIIHLQNLVQGIELPEGTHSITFKYNPFLWQFPKRD